MPAKVVPVPSVSLGRRLTGFARTAGPTIFVFAIAGPIAGFLAILLPLSLTAIPGPLGAVQGLLAMLTMMPFGLLFAYMLGTAPALLTGVTVAIVDHSVDLGSYRTPAAILMGAFITAGLLYRSAGFNLGDDAGAYLPGSAFAAAVGAIAGGACAWLAPRRVASPPQLDGPRE